MHLLLPAALKGSLQFELGYKEHQTKSLQYSTRSPKQQVNRDGHSHPARTPLDKPRLSSRPPWRSSWTTPRMGRQLTWLPHYLVLISSPPFAIVINSCRSGAQLVCEAEMTFLSHSSDASADADSCVTAAQSAETTRSSFCDRSSCVSFVRMSCGGTPSFGGQVQM